MGCGSSSYTSPPGGVDADNGTDGTSSDRHTNTVGHDSPVTRPGEERRSIATRYRHPISDNSSANIGPTPTPAHLGDNAIYDDEFCNNDDKGKEAGQRGKKNADHVRDDVASGAPNAERRTSRRADDSPNGYIRNEVGLMELYLDFRSARDKETSQQSPEVKAGELYTDTEFDVQRAIENYDGLEWKRTREFRKNPKLFTEGTTRFDIGQGSAGTCWFLSTVASLASEASLLKQVIPEDAYKIGTSAYDGMFHARFWHFGKWEDVYIDDYLPIINGIKPWGAHSASDEDEMWVALLEKAFARYHGSYNAIYGGQPGDAYVALTGGTGERIDFKEDDTTSSAFLNRLQNAVRCGAQVMCSVPDEHDGQHGLIGGHAYTVTGVAEIKGTMLLRVRNPWGHTEWTGAWSDKSTEWEGVPEEQLQREKKDDGEFWVCLADFLTYFSDTTICSLTPDFDLDGATSDDSLNMCSMSSMSGRDQRLQDFKGEWKTRALRSLFLKQNHILSRDDCNRVPRCASGGPARSEPLGSQRRRLPVRCDVVKVDESNDRFSEVQILGDNVNVYRREVQSCVRHTLVPGNYAVLPSTDEPGLEDAFLVRVFSPCPLLRVRKVNPAHKFSALRLKSSFSYKGRTYSLDYRQKLPGAWVAGVNAGGQIGNEDIYATNPQYHVTLRKEGPIIISVMQDPFDPLLPIGVRLYKVKANEGALDYQAIVDRFDRCPATASGAQHVYVRDWSIEASYVLPAGSYALIVHTEQQDAEKHFTIRFMSSTQLQIR
ncbi:LOW QUALITY PROTEIN: calpain-5-like [Pomacea canaliculata]|uniref:LOW QUALITY PROTEIN: calpain-5-like n=1 Tax=Pomacea canaliculata TaxID=400727 RepID=UPI000D73BFF2|nr:LOW QUALITY PROTEIN: calpain-5-like [Pomacea canaliculata]